MGVNINLSVGLNLIHHLLIIVVDFQGVRANLYELKRFYYVFSINFQFKDINECTQGAHDCLPNLAYCLNSVGSYSCSCNNEYLGDGKTTCGLYTEGKSNHLVI